MVSRRSTLSKRHSPWARRRRWVVQRLRWCVHFRSHHLISFGVLEGFFLCLALAFVHGFVSLNRLPADVFVLLISIIGLSQRPAYAMSFGVVLALGWDALSGLSMGATLPTLSVMLISSQLLKLYFSPAQAKTEFDFRAVFGALVAGTLFHLFVPEFLSLKFPQLTDAIGLIITLLSGSLMLGALSLISQTKSALSPSPNQSRGSVSSTDRLSFVSS